MTFSNKTTPDQRPEPPKDLTPRLINTSFVDGTYHIELADDATRNSLSNIIIDNLQCALSSLPDNARCVVISSLGPIFCSGHNADDLINISLDSSRALFAKSTNLMIALRECPVPIIARVQGGAIGAGCMLALTCDFVVASEDAYFQTPGGAKGWFCFTPMVALLQHCAPRLAMEMLFTGEKISASKAHQLGIINRVVETSNIAKATEQFISKITQGNPEMLRLAKASFYSTLGQDYQLAMHNMAQMMAETSILPAAQTRLSSIKKSK
jgi:enoyl-CoA hydratase/carnithine racemase